MDITTQNSSGTRHRVKLYPIVPESAYRPPCKKHRDGTYSGTCHCRRWNDERGDSAYQRSDARGNDHRVHAVCWHGFRDFFRAVYRIEPDAVFVTMFDTWRGSEDFELRFRESGHRNIGSQFAPMAAAEACRCPDSGSVNDGPAVAWSARRRYNLDENTHAPSTPLDSYGSDEADGAACRAMANALRAVR